jgi:hypothetical protein
VFGDRKRRKEHALSLTSIVKRTKRSFNKMKENKPSTEVRELTQLIRHDRQARSVTIGSPKDIPAEKRILDRILGATKLTNTTMSCEG